VDPNEQLSVTIRVRRARRETPVRLPAACAERWDALSARHAFAKRFGSAPPDLQRIRQFALRYGLTVVEENAARGSATLSGTAGQICRAFAVELNHYDSVAGQYRGRDGFIHVPAPVAGLIEGVFGLDNQPIGGRNGDGQLGNSLLTPPEVARLYNFPTGRSAAGQTIGIIEFGGGYFRRDVERFFESLGPGFHSPSIIDVGVDNAFNNPGWDSAKDREALLDICIAAAAAPGATIAVYFAPQTQKGWVDAVQRAVHPGPGDPVPSVLSICWFLANGDDLESLRDRRVTTDAVDAISAAFEDAAALGEFGPTVFVASGDFGADSDIDGKARVQYPASDPWVTSCGGTMIQNISGASFDEFGWPSSGGGVSAHFALPEYQIQAGVPLSVNDGSTGRGAPDIAGNASPASGYLMEYKGSRFIASKTSAVAPLYAGLAALLNANLGRQVGFLNPVLYSLGADSRVFRDIKDGTVNGSPGYTCLPGWDACTGWGSVNGSALLSELRRRSSQSS
jgi:kumamolisin